MLDFYVGLVDWLLVIVVIFIVLFRIELGVLFDLLVFFGMFVYFVIIVKIKVNVMNCLVMIFLFVYFCDSFYVLNVCGWS